MSAVATAPIVASSEMPRDEWLAWRRQGIGGSDAAAIAGLDPYRSPFVVFLDKTGQLPDREPSEAMEWGSRLEDVIADVFADRTGLEVRRVPPLTHPAYGWCRATIDREILGPDGPGVLECKAPGLRAVDHWEDDELPDRYIVQLQHYLAVTGHAYGYLAVLVGGQQLRIERVERDDELIDYLLKVEADFWLRVRDNVPPPADPSTATSDALNVLYRDAAPGTHIVLPETARDLIAQREAARVEEKAAAARRDAAENALKAALGDAEAGYLDGAPAVTWKQVTSSRFDARAFEDDHPELAAQYRKPSSHRRFHIPTAKGR